MRKLFLVLAVLLSAVTTSATETQAVIRQNLGRVLERHGITGGDEQYVLHYMALTKVYSTAALRDASTPDVGSIGYAIDDASFKWYSSGGWQAVTLTAGGNATVTGVTYANGGVDRSTAAALAIGATSATAVNIGATATPVAITAAGAVTIPSTTTATGAIYANGGVDRSTAAALAIGATNATVVNVTPPVALRHRLLAKTDDYTFAFATDCGAVVTEATASKSITLPLVTTASAGCQVTVVFTSATASNLGTIVPNASDGIAGSCGSVVIDGTASKTLINTAVTHKLGDSATLVSTGASGAAAWLITACTGVFAEGS